MGAGIQLQRVTINDAIDQIRRANAAEAIAPPVVKHDGPPARQIDDAHAQRSRQLIDSHDRRVAPADISKAGVHELSGARVLATQISLPKDHPATTAIDNAYRVDSEGKPAEAKKQYRRALETKNRIRGEVANELVEMITLNRIGLASVHQVKQALDGGGSVKQAEAEAREAIASSLAIAAKAENFKYGGPSYNLACLETHLGNTDAAFKALKAALEADPKFFAGLADRDKDLAPLWKDPRFGELIPITEKSARTAAAARAN